MRLRISAEDHDGRAFAEAYLDFDERLLQSEAERAIEKLIRNAVSWLDSLPAEQLNRLVRSSRAAQRRVHSDRDGSGRQPPTVANVDRSTSAESKEAQS